MHATMYVLNAVLHLAAFALLFVAHRRIDTMNEDTTD